MRSSIILLTLLLGLPVVAETFESAELGFKLTYPSHWQVLPQRSFPLVLTFPGASDPNLEHVRMQVDRLTGNGGLDMLAEMGRRSIESNFPGIKMVESKSITFGNVKNAHRFRYEGETMGRQMVITQAMAMKGSTYYELLMLATKDNHKKQSRYFEQLISSFKAQ